MFEPVKIKNKNQWLIKHSKYVFREDWILQADALGSKRFLEWVALLDSEFGSAVSLMRDYYISIETKEFEEPAGVKVLFTNARDAQKYCKLLNTGV